VSTTCFMVTELSECWNDGGEENVGAMVWRYHTPDEHDTSCRPFPHLGVMTPAGLVCLDCPESDAPYGKWIRTGEPPMVTVTPSLNVSRGEWHGFLSAGELTP